MKHARFTSSLPLATMRPLALALLLPFAAAAAPTDPTSPVRLGSNENGFGFTPKAKAAVIAAVESGNYYNRNEVAELTALCAKKEGVGEDYIFPTAGSGPVLELTAMAYAKPGKNIVTAAPGYPQLTGAFAEYGGDIRYVHVAANRGYDFKALLAAIDENTAIAYICNPNNPTGVLADAKELREFILKAPPHVLVFVDEAYLELSESGLLANTAAPLVKMRKNLIVSRTFSKAYGLAGFRCGYGIGNPETLANLKKYDPGVGPSFLAAIAAQEAVKDQEYLETTRQRYIATRKMVTAEFDRLGLEYAQPSGAFVLFKAGMPSADFRKKMLDENIMVTTPFGTGPTADEYTDWVRVSIGTEDEMGLFIGALNKILGKT